MLEGATSRRLLIRRGWEMVWRDAPFVVNITLDSDGLGHPSLFIRPRIPEESSISHNRKEKGN
jgi:hypothetical protein